MATSLNGRSRGDAEQGEGVLVEEPEGAEGVRGEEHAAAREAMAAPFERHARTALANSRRSRTSFPLTCFASSAITASA
jgi:hypothetical protein